jgi:hypothetical protein
MSNNLNEGYDDLPKCPWQERARVYSNDDTLKKILLVLHILILCSEINIITIMIISLLVIWIKK